MPSIVSGIPSLWGIIDEVLNFAPVSIYSLSYDYFVLTTIGLSKIRFSADRGTLLLSDPTPWVV